MVAQVAAMPSVCCTLRSIPGVHPTRRPGGDRHPKLIDVAAGNSSKRHHRVGPTAILSTSLVGAAAPLPENVGKPDLAPLLPRRSLGSWVGARKTVGTPVLAADAVVHREKTIGVVALLDLSEALVVRTPKCLLPIGLKVVAFVDVGAC